MLTMLHIAGNSGASLESHALSAASAAVTASETSSRKPIATTRPNERSAIDQEGLEVDARVGLHPPDGVQRHLQLEERTGGRDQKGDAADHRGDDAGAALAGAFEQTLHGERALAAEEVIELARRSRRAPLRRRRPCRQSPWRPAGPARSQTACSRPATRPGARIIVPPGTPRGPEHSQDHRRAHHLEYDERVPPQAVHLCTPAPRWRALQSRGGLNG